MVVRIRLQRFGRKGRPFYRVVVADARAPRDGKFIEIVGTYNPIPTRDGVKEVTFKVERVRYWIGVGAQPSDRVAWLLGQFGILPPKVVPVTRTKRHVPKAERKELKSYHTTAFVRSPISADLTASSAAAPEVLGLVGPRDLVVPWGRAPSVSGALVDDSLVDTGRSNSLLGVNQLFDLCRRDVAMLMVSWAFLQPMRRLLGLDLLRAGAGAWREDSSAVGVDARRAYLSMETLPPVWLWPGFGSYCTKDSHPECGFEDVPCVEFAIPRRKK